MKQRADLGAYFNRLESVAEGVDECLREYSG